MKSFQAMRCPKCGSMQSRVVDKRNYFSQVRRRRECLECGCRFTTRERVDEK